MARKFSIYLCLLFSACLRQAFAVDVAGATQDFLQASFDKVPAPSTLWLRGSLKEDIRSILDHDYGALRLRYWREGTRTAWVLDEIGKEKPITTGLVVEDGRIQQVRVLAFRESRGGEVRYAFFTDQFNAVSLDGQGQLNRHIDNITGATLSVRALTKLARLALHLHDQVVLKDVPTSP